PVPHPHTPCLPSQGPPRPHPVALSDCPSRIPTRNTPMKHPLALALALALAAALPAHAQASAQAATVNTSPAAYSGIFSPAAPLPLHYPQFDRIRGSDFGPAFESGRAQQLQESEAIANDPAAPTFENTVVALEKSGRVLDRATTVFFNLDGADTNDARKQLDE